MRLSDIIGHMDLSVYPQIALVLFGVVFVGVVWRAVRSDPDRSRRCASIPLADDAPAGAGNEEASR